MQKNAPHYSQVIIHYVSESEYSNMKITIIRGVLPSPTFYSIPS